MCVGSSSALGQWRALSLHPVGAFASEIDAVTPEFQLGTAAPSGAFLAGWWAGSAQSWSSLDAYGSVVAVAGDQWAGYMRGHATLWVGPAHTPVDLHPSGFVGSLIAATTGTTQAGTVTAGNLDRAAVWHGTAASVLVLHPPGAYDSIIYAADGDQQGGYVRYPNSVGAPGPEQAALWSGTAESFVDLNPPGHAGSIIFGMGSGHLVGTVGNAVGSSAAFWPSATTAYIDLNPPGVHYAQANACCADAQVGVASTAEFGSTAAIWFGTAQSMVALGPFLPSNYRASVATSVAEDAQRVLYVGGYAVNDATGYEEAVLWIGTAGCYANCDNSTTAPVLNVNDFLCFLSAFSSGSPYANCDGSTAAPVMNVNDFICFMSKFAQGCP